MEIYKKGVYGLFDGDELVYIGQSTNLYSRIGNHIKEDVKKFDSFELFPVSSEYTEDDLNSVEARLISWFLPKYNKALAYGDKQHKCKKKDGYCRSIRKIVEMCDAEISKTDIVPPQFCFCKDCAFNGANHDGIPSILSYRLKQHCFSFVYKRQEEWWNEYDGCMKGLPMDECKAFAKREPLTEEEVEKIRELQSRMWGNWKKQVSEQRG